MPERELSVEEAYKLLTDWTKSLLGSLENSLPAIQHALDPSTELPKNCPSHASLALMEFRPVENSFEEVKGIMPIVEAAIRKAGK